MISYIIQTIAVTIFGPILALLYAIYDVNFGTIPGEAQRESSRFWISAWNLSRSIQMGNVLTSVSVLTASIIRIQQLAPVAEITFIKMLGMYQLYVAGQAALSYCIIFGVRQSFYGFSYLFYFLMILGIWIALSVIDGYPSSKAILLDDITSYCVLDWDYPISIAVSLEDSRFYRIVFSSAFGTEIAIIIVFLFLPIYFIEWLKRVYDVLRYSFDFICEYLCIKPKTVKVCLILTLVSGLIVTESVLLLLSLESQRQWLQLVSGNADQDSQWGFGQITAVLLWAPTLNNIFVEIYGQQDVYYSISLVAILITPRIFTP